MFFRERPHRRLWPYILLSIFLLFAGVAVYGYQYVKHLTPEQLINNPLVQRYVPEESKDVLTHIPILLGYKEPKTYLLLFQNNTELRPSGGFIGVYAVIRMDQGNQTMVVLEGTELLDRRTPATWKPVPPKPLTDYLKVDRWYFRDSNWSPDFSESARKALELYHAEGGVVAADIDAVVSITPTVLEELMKITGSFTIQGIEFTAENVTEKLEYEVEYGYDDRGIARQDRKQIIVPFTEALISHLKETALQHAGDYLALAMRMVDEKHIMAYSPQTDLSSLIEKESAGGRVKESAGDYLWWVDANMSALKTDHAITRQLRYSIEPAASGTYQATAVMTYKHAGSFDWRTTRYRTYTRVFVPRGARLIRVEGGMKTDRSEEAGIIDQGETLGKQWFGTFISIEPGKEKTLTFVYELPRQIAEQAANGVYTLVVQKQLGSIAHGLTLDLDFGTTITAAEPAEAKEKWGDRVYEAVSDLRIDRDFKIKF